MAQEAGGLPYYSGNQSGVGAVYFDKTIDPLALHLKNVETLDTGDDFWKAWKLKEVADQKRAKLAEDITKDLTANPEGAMPEDIQNVFIPKMKEIRDRYAKIVTRLGGDNVALTRDPEYLQLMADKNSLTGLIEQSKEDNKLFTAEAAAYRANPDKFSEESLSNMGVGRTLPMDKRREFIAQNNGTFLRSVTPSFTTNALDKVKDLKGTIYDKRAVEYVDADGTIKQSETEVVNPTKLRGFVKGYLANFPNLKAVQQEFALQSPSTQEVYLKAAQEFPQNGNPLEQYAYDVFKNPLGQTQKNLISGFSPEAQERAKGKAKEDEALYLYDLANGILSRNLDYAANISKDATGKQYLINDPTKGQNTGDLISLDLKNLKYGTRPVEKKDALGEVIGTDYVDDRIISVTVPPTGNMVKLKTLGGEQNVSKDEFLEVVFNSNYPEAKGIELVKKSAQRRGNVTSSGAVKTPQVSAEITNVLKVPQEQLQFTSEGVATTKQIEPVKQKSSAPKTLKGNEDPTTLVVNEVYVLDGKNYKWNGKNLVKVK